jgi:hypothetical protein
VGAKQWAGKATGYKITKSTRNIPEKNPFK